MEIRLAQERIIMALLPVALEEPESLQVRDYADDLLSILTPAGSFLRPPKIAL